MCSTRSTGSFGSYPAGVAPAGLVRVRSLPQRAVGVSWRPATDSSRRVSQGCGIDALSDPARRPSVARFPELRSNSRTANLSAVQQYGYSASEQHPTISVGALLELVKWCDQRLDESHGGEPCPTTKGGQQIKGGRASRLIESIVGTAAVGRPSEHRPDRGSNRCTPDPSFRAEGGI